MGLILAVTLAFGSVSVLGTSKVASAKKSQSDANLSLYEKAGIYYSSFKSTSEGDSSSQPSTPSTPSTPVEITYYDLYSINSFPTEGYYKRGTSEGDVKSRLPGTVTLVLNSTGTYTRSTSISWTKSSETDEKMIFAGKVSLPSDVLNPKEISLDYEYTAIWTDKEPIEPAQIVLKSLEGSTQSPTSFEYTGKQICPEIESVKMGEAVIDKDKYTVTYGENTEVGKGAGSITISAKEDSEYIGTATLRFDIVKAKKLRVLYGSRSSFIFNPKMAGDSDYTLDVNINEARTNLTYTVAYSQDYAADEEKKTKDPAQAQKITMDENGDINIAKGIENGDYTITVSTTKREHFVNPQPQTFLIRVGVKPVDDNMISAPAGGTGADQVEVTYELNGGVAYIMNADGKEIPFSDDKIIDHYDKDTVKEDPYKICLGAKEDKNELILKEYEKGKKTYVFSGWYKDAELKNKIEASDFESESKITLYAKWLMKSDLKVSKTKYTVVYSKNLSFKIEAKSSTKVAYKSSDTKICRVDSKGKVLVKGPGKATITVKAKKSAIREEGTIEVTVIIKPKKMSIKSAYCRYGRMEVRWDPCSDVDGYELGWSRDASFKIEAGKKAIINNSKADHHRFKNVPGGTTLYVRIRSFIIVDGKKVYSMWSLNKSVYSKKQ